MTTSECETRRAPFDTMTEGEVACLLQRPAAEVQALLCRGKLRGIRIGKIWRIDPAALAEYVAGVEQEAARRALYERLPEGLPAGVASLAARRARGRLAGHRAQGA